MPVIKDIRLYRSKVDNIDGNSHPNSFMNKELNIVIRRIVMKLRENGFELENFDHIYINLTTINIENEMVLSKRTIDKYHSWYRYYDVEISQSLFDSLETKQCMDEVLTIVGRVLCHFFNSQDFTSDKIQSCILEAISKGENMTMKFKEKVATKNKAIIYLRYLDSGRYFPLLRVLDLEDNILLEEDLPETNSLDAFGTIQLSTKKVTIKPRKNMFADGNEPISFAL